MTKRLQLIVQQVIHRFTWVLSVFLIVTGAVLMFLFTPNFSLTNLWGAMGDILLGIGVVTLILELLSLERLVTIRIPQVIFSHGYLEVAKDDELTQLLDDTVRAKLGVPGVSGKDLELGRDWLLSLLALRCGKSTKPRFDCWRNRSPKPSLILTAPRSRSLRKLERTGCGSASGTSIRRRKTLLPTPSILMATELFTGSGTLFQKTPVSRDYTDLASWPQVRANHVARFSRGFAIQSGQKSLSLTLLPGIPSRRTIPLKT